MIIFFFLFKAQYSTRKRSKGREKEAKTNARSTPTNVLNGFLETILSLINRCQQHMCITHILPWLYFIANQNNKKKDYIPSVREKAKRIQTLNKKTKIKKQPKHTHTPTATK